MALVSERGLILQAFPYGDTSKILRVLCVDQGVRSVIAKGAQRPRSRFGGVLEPFTEGIVQFFLREGRDLHTLTGFDLVRSRQALGRDLAAFAGASLMAELLLRFATEEPQPQLFHALTASLDRLASADPGSSGALALGGVWELVALLGYQPELDACVQCGRVLEPDEASRFDVEAGGVACTLCRRDGRIVGAATRAEVSAMAAGRIIDPEPAQWGLHRALLRAFVLTHLAHERPLRSLELFAELLR